MGTHKFDPSEPTIQVTPTANDHLVEFLAEHPDALGFRLSTKKTGCSGLSYVTEIAEEIRDTDISAETNANIKILIDQKSIAYLNGLTIDFVKKDLGQSQLAYINPHESAHCGCGESFSVDEQP